MTKPNGWRCACAAMLLVAAITIPATAQTLTTLVLFTGKDGAMPTGPLVQGIDGQFYGVTYGGGTGANCNNSIGAGCGTVYKVSTTGQLTSLYNFCSQANCSDGQYPDAGLVLAIDGSFYGTTSAGGAMGFGTVFKISSAGELNTLHSFQSTDGAAPAGPLVQANDGEFYGTTAYGGANGYGTVFKITPSGTLTTLYSFCAQANCADGSVPLGGLLWATNGNLYGTTTAGGAHHYYGTIFKITLAGKLTTWHSFNYLEGAYPYAGVIQAVDGNLYGTTEGGDAASAGTVFQLASSGAFTVLHSFDNADGTAPSALLVQATDGNFYGTTLEGGIYDLGTLFQMNSASTLATLYNFIGGGDGGVPGAVFQATDGNLYGTTALRTAYGSGTFFRYTLNLGPFVSFVHSPAKVGQTFGILGQGLTGASAVSLNGTPANFTVVSDHFIKATVPAGATTGYVTVNTPSSVLTSNVPFQVIP